MMIIKSNSKINSNLYKVIKFETTHIPGQPGYLGAYYFLTISYETVDGTIKSGRYFMKSLPYHDAILTKAVEDWGIFRKEAELYSHIFTNYEKDGKVIKWVPECFLARHNLLVMEDLTSEGYQTISFQTTLNEQHMKVIFDCLAQMHACSLNFEINHLCGKSIGSLYNDDILFETTFTSTSGWFVAGLKVTDVHWDSKYGIQKIAVARNRYSRDPEKKKIIESQLWGCLEKIYKLAENTQEFRSVIVHRDLWINNLMFKYGHTDDMCEQPTDCILIDFQLARYLPPCVDFLCALYILTNNEHRTHYADQYVELYYNSLQKKIKILGLDGPSILSREQFEKSLDHYRLFGLVWAGVLHGFVNFPKGLLAQLHQEDPQTYTKISMENRDDIILKYYDSDRFFHDRLDDIVTELLEYLFNFK
uniref:CHK domain-containing protein n=1 Tax=Anopheles christyi TaxID=43041 RepID=A0A182K3L4_9DIPT